MTNGELSKLYHINKEIERLQGQLDELNRMSKREAVTDSVKGSMTEFPYVQRSVTIYGIPTQAFTSGKYELEIAEIKTLLELNINKSIIEKVRLERYIQSVDDTEVRAIMSLRHINGLTWKQVAKSVGYATEDSVRMMHDRYLKKNYVKNKSCSVCSANQ